jgi:glycosyltransferase involved in cell wall biosynthesis
VPQSPKVVSINKENKNTVTVVISTYGRPDVLVCALQSVLLQTYQHWEVLIIGDNCDSNTLNALSPFLSDARFHYINLPFRCGEQALPNTAGMFASKTEFVALLNQDDIWLPWHLELSIKTMQSHQADFLIGRAAWSWGQMREDKDLALLHGVSPQIGNWEQIFLSGHHLVEPASCWVLRRSEIAKVGYWHSAAYLHRRPIQDWCLRAWRAGLKLINCKPISCIKFENHWSESAPERRYDVADTPQKSWIKFISNPKCFDEVRTELIQLGNNEEAVGRGMQLKALELKEDLVKYERKLITPDYAKLYRQTGLDSFNWMCAEIGMDRGWYWKNALKSRTGEQVMSPPNVEDVIKFVTSNLTN